MKEKLIYELKSFFTTFITIFAVEAYAQLVLVYNGNWTYTVLHALGLAALRSAIKALLQLVFPKLFPSFQTNTTTTTLTTTTDVPLTSETCQK